MGLGTIKQRRRILDHVKDLDRKYRRPFETGEINIVNVLGGSWNEYAEVVFSMLLADTLLNVEQQLRLLNANLNPDAAAEADALEAEGGFRWLMSGVRYGLGESLEPFRFSIWDREELVLPVETFPHSAEGRASAERRFHEIEPKANTADSTSVPPSPE